MSFQAEH